MPKKYQINIILRVAEVNFLSIIFEGASLGMRSIITIFLKSRKYLLNDKTQCFVKFLGIRPITFWFTRRYVNFNFIFGRGMRFFLSNWNKIYQKCVNYRIAPLCEISNDSIENFLRYSEKSWFYVDFNQSFGRGMLFYQPINLIFEKNWAIVIIHHPAKFHENRSRTFWDNRKIHTHTDRQTDRHTHRHMHADENNTCPKTKFLGKLKIALQYQYNLKIGHLCLG